jgi:hypothetical protein
MSIVFKLEWLTRPLPRQVGGSVSLLNTPPGTLTFNWSIRGAISSYGRNQTYRL